MQGDQWKWSVVTVCRGSLFIGLYLCNDQLSTFYTVSRSHRNLPVPVTQCTSVASPCCHCRCSDYRSFPTSGLQSRYRSTMHQLSLKPDASWGDASRALLLRESSAAQLGACCRCSTADSGLAAGAVPGTPAARSDATVSGCGTTAGLACGCCATATLLLCAAGGMPLLWERRCRSDSCGRSTPCVNTIAAQTNVWTCKQSPACMHANAHATLAARHTRSV